jgi:hypothetical protein
MRRPLRCSWVAAALLSSACTAGGGRHATARLQAFRYADSSGLSVTSDGVELTQPVAGGVVVEASGLVEEIVTPANGTVASGADDGGGHNHLVALARARPDVITTASSIASTGAPGQKRRVEGNVGVLSSRRLGEVPIEVGARFRTSEEPDYLSFSGSLHVSADLLERNLTVAAFGGYGSDTVSPLTKPAGQDDLWPAQHQRLNGGFAVTQLLSPELALSGGASINYQYGMLANPYRRAVVRPPGSGEEARTLYSESVPSERVRGTAFARLAWWLADGTALHLRQGVYADGWGVRSLVPELTLARELGRSGLFLARGRLYFQSPATFYRPEYGERVALMSGDVRLGRVREKLVGAELRWAFIGQAGMAGALEATASYDRSWVSYPDVHLETGANVLALSLAATF